MDDKGNPLEVVVTFNPDFVVDTIDGELGADYTIMEIVPVTTTQDILAYARDHGYQLESESEGITEMVDVTITVPALEKITKQQCLSLVRLGKDENVKHIHAQLGGLDAPSTHIVFRIDHEDDTSPTYGSISPKGPVKK
jgi:hypothetical protein